MILYILKSTTCLALFFLFYKLFLEKENMHVFKRFYLVASLVAAFSIPFITFTTYAIPALEELSQVTANDSYIGILVEENRIDYIAITLWIMYGLGVLLFGLKFIKNIRQLFVKIKRNDKIKNKFITKVLLVDVVTPHTFFKYVFLNKSAFENKKIPKEVLIHEETHALQKHSLDVLLVELLQVVFWFNPFIYLMKHAIKLNHEFLADRAVLNYGIETTSYQRTLLHFSSSTNQPQLANAINYSFIKKRFTIMKTHTSKKAIWLRSLLMLPLLAILIYGFSEKVTQEKLINAIEETDKDTQVKDVKIVINKNREILINGKNYATLENLTDQVNGIISIYDAEQLKNVTAMIHADATLKMAFITNVKLELIKTGIVRYTQTNYIPYQDKATPAQVIEYNKLANKYNSMSKDQFIVKQKEVERIRYIYDLMSLEQRRKGEPFPNFPPPPPSPEKVYIGHNNDNVPPPPPSPPNPLDHIIELAKKGATFYNEGEKISSDKAIAIVKKNKSINIQVIDHDSKNPVVKLSKKPIILKKK